MGDDNRRRRRRLTHFLPRPSLPPRSANATPRQCYALQMHHDSASAIRVALACRKIQAAGACIKQLAQEEETAAAAAVSAAAAAAPTTAPPPGGVLHFTNVQTITTARIPIVKFTHGPSGLNCDLCCDNLLPVYNTRLLKVRIWSLMD